VCVSHTSISKTKLHVRSWIICASNKKKYIYIYISCNAYITRARRKKKKPEAQIQPASLHKLCIFLPLLFKKNSNERTELKISKRISFSFSRLLLSIKNRRGLPCAYFLNLVRVLDFNRVGRINLYFKTVQNSIVLVKKKKNKTKVNRLQSGFWPGFSRSTHRIGRVTPGHDFLYFFINLARFQLWISRIPGWPAGLSWVSKLCYGELDW